MHMVKQHEGSGGDTIISDGLYNVEFLKKHYPFEYQILTRIPIYSWDKGVKSFQFEMEEYHKISKKPIISVDSYGNLDTLRINHQNRDSHMDTDPEFVNIFYKSIKLFNDLLYANSISYKLQNSKS